MTNKIEERGVEPESASAKDTFPMHQPLTVGDLQCIQCGTAVPGAVCGRKSPCPSCGFPYPIGDCSDLAEN